MANYIKKQKDFLNDSAVEQGDIITSFEVSKNGTVTANYSDGSFSDMWTLCGYLMPSFDVDGYLGIYSPQISYLDIDVCAY